MFNGYNETPLTSYDYNQERLEKKQENVAKWSYGHDAAVHPAQTHPNSRHAEFWPGRANFLGVGNVLKCNCAGCYPSLENQSYQSDSTRHRPWLPRTFQVPVNGSNESCKLPTHQWDNGIPNQGACYSENNLSYMQENGGKYPYYRPYQNTRLSEPNQPGVITSVKEAEFGKKGKNEMTSREQESPIENGALCNLGYNLTKRSDGRSYCEPNDKHSNVASYSVDHHLVRLPVVEPFIKAVPSNLSQNRVPSTDYRSVKDNVAQSYIDQGYGDPRKMTEPVMNGDKRFDSFPLGQIPTEVHVDYSHLQEAEPQKLFFDNGRQSEYYSRNNIRDFIKRNDQNLDNRKDCAMSLSEQHYNVSRSKYPDEGKSPYEAFYPKDFDKRPENATCFQRNENMKNENMNVHARLPRSALLFNDPRFADRTQNSFAYQTSSNAYRNYLRPEYHYQSLNSQDRYEYPGESFQRNEINEFRVPPQQTQSCDQFPSSQQMSGFLYEQSVCQQSPDKIQQFYLAKEPVQTDLIDNRKPNYLEAVRCEDMNKNGTSKISPLRLLRKKKFINIPQERAPVSTNADAPPGLDVRKFWSTWADEEEENVAPTQMVVLDCQNIDPEQAKLLHLCETDPVRAVHLEAGNIVLKGVKELTGLSEEVQQTSENVTKFDEQTKTQEDKTEKREENNSPIKPNSESKFIEPKTLKKVKSIKKKTEVMDKWTEKKFDFLKRAEESKAAEVLRHEEEKKKIIETTLTLQQSLKKTEKPQEKNVLFDENSESGTENGNSEATNLPTCEYRRNKFLDYSEKNVIVNGKEKILAENELQDEIKKEENIKVECSDNTTDMLLNVKLKEETGFEMDDILKKISEINFEGSEIKLEEEDKTVRKSKKQKKKTDQLEADKLTVETVTKPTIKFSIQKSHDLKISFKVLNSKEEKGEDPQDKGSTLEDSKNSTEFTLRYKTFQRDSDRKAISGFKKKHFRKKKRIPEMKNPVLKIKKSRFMQQEEKDPLTGVNGTFADGYSNPDGFQVHETVDSAKIKLTFKRHKGNFETEYKVNSNNAAKVEKEERDLQEEEDDSEEVTKSSGGEAASMEIFQTCSEQTSDGKSDPFTRKPEEELITSSTIVEEEKSALPIFSEFPSETPFEVEPPDNIFEETVEPDPIEETEKPGQEQTVTDVNHVINCDEARESVSLSDRLDVNSKEEIEEISSDFNKSTKSPEIEINCEPGDSLEIEKPKIEINCGSENSNGIKREENPPEFKVEDGEETPKIIQNPDNETGLLDLISEEGVDVKEMKITENPDCVDDSLENQECKNSPLELPEGLENSLEDLIRDDFSPRSEKPKTPEISEEEIRPRTSPSQIESEHEENSIATFDLEKVENSSPKENLEFEIKSAVVNTSKEALKPEIDSSILSETVSVDQFGDVDTTKCEPENKVEPVKSLPNDSCSTVEPNQFIDFLTDAIDEPELEDGEIIDTSDEDNKNQRKTEFLVRKIDRRHSISSRKRESENLKTWSRKKFLKAKSCPPELTFLESSTIMTDILIENIPLPIGPPPLESCFNLTQYKYESEAKEKPKESIFTERVETLKKSESIFVWNDLEKSGNPSPPVAPVQLGILQRNSKIKFSFSRRSKFSKLTRPNSNFVDPPEMVEPKSCSLEEKESVEPSPKECQTEEVPNVPKVIEKSKNYLESIEMLSEDLEENIETIDSMTDLIRNEFYECEDIPTSEDLTNGDDLEIEKVNDDKFRNIMQNCLDNAKKFLNVGNLKLFSCSVDDLLELDCQPEFSFEDEPEKQSKHVSRDVLLTSCGETEDLGLSENIQSGDISVDFVPPFCSDVCPEILPVDNWPYLEEEVISSPNKPKQDETDLIPALDILDCPDLGSVEKPERKRVISESFRRSSDDDFRICSKFGQRRKTIDGITATSYKQDIRNYRNEFMLLKNEKENKSLKCRVSLKKLTGKHEIDFDLKNQKSKNGVLKKSKSLDYQSPSWQPKVMLFRISKNELRKILKTKRQFHLDGEPQKTEISCKFDTEIEPVIKKQKSESDLGKLHVKPDEGSDGGDINTTVMLSDVQRKPKKSRFRNLHTKKKTELKVSTHQKEVVNPEIVLAELFKNCDVEKESGGSHGKSKDDSRPDAKKNKRDEERQKDRHKEGESRKHSSRHGPGHEKSRSSGKQEKEDKKAKSPRWVCEVCGFDEADERVVHIKNHPFHCQSCHLAFKTESHFISHLTKKHKNIRNQHHCLLCELSFDTEEQYQRHLDSREHKHLESVEKNTINTLFTLLTGAPCPVLGLVEAKPEWLPNQAGTVHFYHQATPLSLALQYLKMHRDLSSFSTTSSTHPT